MSGAVLRFTVKPESFQGFLNRENVISVVREGDGAGVGVLKGGRVGDGEGGGEDLVGDGVAARQLVTVIWRGGESGSLGFVSG